MALIPLVLNSTITATAATDEVKGLDRRAGKQIIIIIKTNTNNSDLIV